MHHFHFILFPCIINILLYAFMFTNLWGNLEWFFLLISLCQTCAFGTHTSFSFLRWILFFLFIMFFCFPQVVICFYLTCIWVIFGHPINLGSRSGSQLVEDFVLHTIKKQCNTDVHILSLQHIKYSMEDMKCWAEKQEPPHLNISLPINFLCLPL